MSSLEARSETYDQPLPEEILEESSQAAIIEFPRNHTGKTLEEIDEQWLVTTVGKMLEEMGVRLKTLTPQSNGQVGLTAFKIGSSDVEAVWDLLDSFNDTVADGECELTLHPTTDDGYQLWSYGALGIMSIEAPAFPVESKLEAQQDKKSKYDLADYIIQQRDDPEGWRPEEY